MKYEALLSKMICENGKIVQYYLNTENHILNLNQFLGKTISISFIDHECFGCRTRIKIFSQGFCYNCFYNQPSAGDWLIRPELSKAHLEIEDRDLTYEKKIQIQPHIVYLAFSGTLKIGVTRKLQIPVRWIDQGATKAIPILETPNRYLAGITEVFLKNFVNDKTSWKKMLQNENTDETENDALIKKKHFLKNHILQETKEYFIEENHLVEINYPVETYPKKIKSLNLNKEPTFRKTLSGIKGQYLIFKDDSVFNMRNHKGYRVSLEIH